VGRCFVSASMPPAMAPAPLTAPFHWRPTSRAPASGTVAERGDRHDRFMSGGRNRRPAVRRGDPAPQAWGRKRRRVAPREPPPATTLPPHLRKSLLGQIWGLYGPIEMLTWPRSIPAQVALDRPRFLYLIPTMVSSMGCFGFKPNVGGALRGIGASLTKKWQGPSLGGVEATK
jgi:hypothetical protein